MIYNPQWDKHSFYIHNPIEAEEAVLDNDHAMMKTVEGFSQQFHNTHLQEAMTKGILYGSPLIKVEWDKEDD